MKFAIRDTTVESSFERSIRERATRAKKIRSGWGDFSGKRNAGFSLVPITTPESACAGDSGFCLENVRANVVAAAIGDKFKRV
jgi:hypothetical protein